jgi:hypothetical protein
MTLLCRHSVIVSTLIVAHGPTTRKEKRAARIGPKDFVHLGQRTLLGIRLGVPTPRFELAVLQGKPRPQSGSLAKRAAILA